VAGFLLADFRYIADYQQPPRLRHRDPCLGSGYWYGGPWAVTTAPGRRRDRGTDVHPAKDCDGADPQTWCVAPRPGWALVDLDLAATEQGESVHVDLHTRGNDDAHPTQQRDHGQRDFPRVEHRVGGPGGHRLREADGRAGPGAARSRCERQRTVRDEGGGEMYRERAEAAPVLVDSLGHAYGEGKRYGNTKEFLIAELRGVQVVASRMLSGDEMIVTLSVPGRSRSIQARDFPGVDAASVGLVRRVENMVSDTPHYRDELHRRHEHALTRIAELEAVADEPFEHTDAVRDNGTGWTRSPRRCRRARTARKPKRKRPNTRSGWRPGAVNRGGVWR